MVHLDNGRIRQYLSDGDNQHLEEARRGKLLEELACYLFGSVPGLRVRIRAQMDPFRSMEIDVALSNDHDPRGLISREFPGTLVIECKNLGGKVSSHQVRAFSQKLETMGLPYGVMLALNGISGNPEEAKNAHQAVRDTLAKGRLIVVLLRQHIEHLEDTDQLVEILQQRTTEVRVLGNAFG